MFQAVSRRTVDWLIQGGSIAEEEREVHEFGLDKLFSMLSNFFFVTIIGLLSGMVVQTIVFYATYVVLRVYAGGYHADNPLRCFFISIGIVVPCLFVIHFQQMWNVPIVFYGLLVLCTVTLAVFGPTGSKNKMPDELEKVVYRRRLWRNLVITTASAIVLSLLDIPYIASAVLCGILLATITAVVGKVKLRLQMRHN